MIESELDKPPDKDFNCVLCGGTMRVTHHWLIDQWLHPSVHNKCAEEFERSLQHSKHKEPDPAEVTPERYRHFDPNKFPHKDAMKKACFFDPDAEHRTLVIAGLPGTGKSRLMWEVIKAFFADLKDRTGKQYWVDAFYYPDLVSDFQRDTITKMKLSRYLYLADVGSVDASGRERAVVQQVVRTRVSKGQWLFLEIDDFDLFDPGLSDLLEGRSLKIFIEE